MITIFKTHEIIFFSRSDIRTILFIIRRASVIIIRNNIKAILSNLDYKIDLVSSNYLERNTFLSLHSR